MNKILCSIFLMLIFLSCQLPEQTEKNIFSITSPHENWTYYDTSRIVFSVNVNSADIIWSSSIDGILGTGNSQNYTLSAGKHNITATIGTETQTLSIFVQEKILNQFDESSFLLHIFPYFFTIKKGTYEPYLVSLDGSVKEMHINSSIQISNYSSAKANVSDIPIRDFHIPLQKALPLINKENSAHTRRGQKEKTGDTHSFFVVNTLSQFSEPHIVQAEKCYSSELLTVWKPIDMSIDTTDLSGFFAEIENLIIPRVTTIWGN